MGEKRGVSTLLDEFFKPFGSCAYCRNDVLNRNPFATFLSNHTSQHKVFVFPVTDILEGPTEYSHKC